MFKRVCSFILTLVILISCNLNVFEINGEEQQVTLVQIPIFSNEIDEKYLTGYLFNNSEYFVSIDDICRITRSTYEISDNKITIKRGIEYVTLYVQDNKITLEGKNVECKIRKYNETYLLKPYSMLKLFGAYCDYFEEDNVFAIIMPEFTISETIDFNLYNGLHYNISKEKISKYLILAGSSMFMDLLSRGTGMISFAFTKGTNEYIDNSLYEISKVNIYNYQNVKNTSNDILNERIYMAEGLLKITDDTNKVFKDILEYDNILNKLSNNIDKLNNIAEIVSIAKSAEEKTNYDLDSYLLLKRTLTHENLDNLNMNFDITDRAEYVSKAMESKLSAYFNTSIDKVQEKLLDEGIEKIFKNVDKIYGADVCSFLMAYDIGTSVTKLLMNNTFEAYKSELNAIYLSEIQNEIFEVALKIYEINRQEHFTNHYNIQRLIDIYSLYDRVTIAMYENFKKADDEFKIFDKEFSNSFADFCDTSADNAYKLSLCKPKDTICSLKQFSDYYENDIFDKYIDKSNTTTETTIITTETTATTTETTTTTTPPNNNSEYINIKMLSLGHEHTAFLSENSTLYMCGMNYSGELGIGTEVIKNTAVPLKIMDNIKSVSLGDGYSAAITEDGSLYMWGRGAYGQLGTEKELGIYSISRIPIKIMDNVKSVSLGDRHSAAITEDGSLYMWGFNGDGQLGNGTKEDSLVPIKIMDNVKSISLGEGHSAAITEDGSLYMCGDNCYGQLGNGESSIFIKETLPIKIMDNVKSISLGDKHSAAITEDGSLYMWGLNYNGQLGNGKKEDSLVPIKIMDNVKSVSLGSYHSAVITEDSYIYTWGFNGEGQLGNGTTEYNLIPVKIDIKN